MIGRVDWAMFIQKIYEAFDKKVNDMVYASLTTLGDAFPAARKAQFIKSGNIDADKMITLAEDVQIANNGAQVIIMGTKAALSKLSALEPVDWISEDMKIQRNTTGKVGNWMGYQLVEIPQIFEANTTNRVLSDTMLYVMPVAENKFIKLVNEGEPIIREITDSDTNIDMTIEYEYQTKMGVGVQINRLFGTYTIIA